ncbi:MAG: hypothetical protein PW788_08930 [Micavibrio sp.]|nr:hypothetical protein [Micavibrio sp.]
MTKKLYVRFSTAQDEQKIFDYYSDNQHEYVAKREPEIWKERIASGAVTLIEDEQGKIVASTITYPIVVMNEKGEDTHKWTEIGSVRVTLDGAGLFKPLLSAAVLRSFLLEPPEDRYAVEIVIGNAHSKHVFTKEGATEWKIPEELRLMVEDSISPDDTTGAVDWFQMGVETIPGLARNITHREANPVVVNSKTGEKFEIDFSKCLLTTVFRDELDKVAGLDLGDTKAPNMSHGIKSCRDKFTP